MRPPETHFRAAALASLLMLAACGGESPPAGATGAAEPALAPAQAAPPSALPPAEPAAPDPEPPSAPPVADSLPVPVAPASWRATMGELSVDGVTVRDVSASCGAFAMMPVIQALGAATSHCPQRASTYLAVALEGGRVTAIDAQGAAAACVRAGVMAAGTRASCQFQLTFAN